MTCETFATESFGNPVTRADKLTLPGAGAHFKLLVSGTQMSVEMREHERSAIRGAKQQSHSEISDQGEIF
jgi:hypothetical protein